MKVYIINSIAKSYILNIKIRPLVTEYALTIKQVGAHSFNPFKHSLYHVLLDFVCFQRVSRFYINISFFQNMSTKFISLRVSLKIAILPVKISSFPNYPRLNGHNLIKPSLKNIYLLVLLT